MRSKSLGVALADEGQAQKKGQRIDKFEEGWVGWQVLHSEKIGSKIATFYKIAVLLPTRLFIKANFLVQKRVKTFKSL